MLSEGEAAEEEEDREAWEEVAEEEDQEAWEEVVARKLAPSTVKKGKEKKSWKS